MATTTFTPAAAQSNLLRRALQADAIVTGLCGAFLLIDAAPLAQFMGLGGTFALKVLGADLLLAAAWIAYEAWRAELRPRAAQIIIGLCALWVLASVVVVAANPFALTVGGRWLVAGVADLTALIGLAEYVGLRRLARKA